MCDANRRNPICRPPTHCCSLSVICPPKPLSALTGESDSEGSDLPVAAAKLPDITASVNVVDPNRVEGKRQTSVDVGDVMELTYKKEKGVYKGKMLKFFRSRVTRTQKRDANGKTVGTKTLGGELMVNIEWLDAPASTASTVIGQIQELKVTDFVKDYKIQQISYNMS